MTGLSGQRLPRVHALLELAASTGLVPKLHKRLPRICALPHARTLQRAGSVPRARGPARLCSTDLFAVVEIAEAIAAELGIKTLAAEAEHFGGRGPVVAGQFERGLNAQPLDHVGRLAHEIL